MKLLGEWVEQSNGGIIFLAGPKFNPTAYGGTPLEALLPVVPDTSVPPEQRAERFKEPVQPADFDWRDVALSPAGRKIPRKMPASGRARVRWVAPVTKAKPGAEVLLVDPTPERMGSAGGMPVIAIQGYGGGQSVYIGIDETLPLAQPYYGGKILLSGLGRDHAVALAQTP